MASKRKIQNNPSEPDWLQILEQRFREADPELFQQTSSFISDLKEQLKATWIDNQEHQEAAARWRKHFEAAATAHDARAKEIELLQARIIALLDALGLDGAREWESALAMVRGKYYNAGDAFTVDVLRQQNDALREVLKQISELPGFEPTEDYGKQVLAVLKLPTP